MKINLCNNLNFIGYKSSKYYNPYTKVSYKDSKTKQDNVPDSLDLEDNDAVYNYSKNRIKNLYEYLGLNTVKSGYYDKQMNTLQARLSDGSVNSSNLAMLLELVRENKLSPEILSLIYKDGKISRNISSDLDKLYQAYMDNVDIQSVFVPQFEDEKEALDKLEIGDVCQIKGDYKISIKIPFEEGAKIKNLYITPETYMELFPPVERFIIRQSSEVGDCYLLAALDSVYQNGNTRYKILEMFNENQDDEVDVAFAGFGGSGHGAVFMKHPGSGILKNVCEKTKDAAICDVETTSRTAEWVKAIELLARSHEMSNYKERAKYAISCEHDTHLMLKKALDEWKIPMPNWLCDYYLPVDIKEKAKYMEGYVHEIRSLRTLDEDEVLFLGEIYKKKEVELFLLFMENNEEMIALTSSDKWDEDLISNPEFTYDEIKEKLSKFNNPKNDFEEYAKLRFQRAIEYLERRGKDKTYKFRGCMPENAYYMIFDRQNVSKRKHAYDDGGCSLDVFSKLFFEHAQRKNIKDAKEELFSDNASKYAFTCSARKESTDNSFPIFAPHAYSLEPVDIKGERRFIIRNPHNSAFEAVFTFEELLKYFSYITFAK